MMSAYVTHLLVVLSLFNTFTWLVHKLEAIRYMNHTRLRSAFGTKVITVNPLHVSTKVIWDRFTLGSQAKEGENVR